MSAAPEPDWLTWSRELLAIAQTGLAFTRDPYDRERYEALRDLAARILGAQGGADPARVVELFRDEQGYATPKVDVRAAVFDAQGRILMVREAADAGRWTLPGGWADVNHSPAQNAEKEALEESGYQVRARKLAAVWDRTRQGHPPSVFACTKLFFVCELLGGEATTSLETTGVGWFRRDALPPDLSTGRVLARQIARMFQHLDDPGLPTDFD
jgi:ADP-ribose pyrophosphatase YjhB (NUDIX family)